MSGNQENGLADRDTFRQGIGIRYHVTDELPIFGRVRLRSLSERERRIIESKRYDDTGRIDDDRYAQVFAWMCIYMVVYPDGKQMFAEMDLDWLSEIDAMYSSLLMSEMNQHAGTNINQEQLKKSLMNAPGSENGSSSQKSFSAPTSTS